MLSFQLIGNAKGEAGPEAAEKSPSPPQHPSLRKVPYETSWVPGTQHVLAEVGGCRKQAIAKA